MENLILYLIKSSGLIGMFFLAYSLLLRKETFFKSNRWFLLAGLFTSVGLPLLFFTKIILVETELTHLNVSNITQSSIQNEVFEINWYLVSGILYAIGIVYFLSKFAFDFRSLSKVLKGKTIQYQAGFKLIDLCENVAPFSFFNTIVYNSTLYSQSELENILEHEKIHSEQNHTIDVLISRLFCIAFWFNPLVWLYTKAIAQNLEFIADREATKKISDKKAYQFTLLKITTQENCVGITNSFYQSLIKKRILMLNKNQSKKWNSWKYAVVIPVLVVFILSFQVNVIAQEKNEPLTTNNGLKVGLHVTSTSTEKTLNAEKDFFQEEFNLEMSFSGIKTNKNNEIIAIKVELKDKEGIRKVNQIEGESPIKPFTVFAEKDSKNELNFGFSADINKASKRHFDLINGIKGAKKENIAIIEDNNFWSIDNVEKNGSNYLIVINGTKQTEDKIIKIPLEEDILSEITLEPQAATEKYGSEGKNGAVEITTGKQKKSNPKKLDKVKDLGLFHKNENQLNLERIDATNITGTKKSTKTKIVEVVSNEREGTTTETAIYIDGIKVDQKELDKLDPSIIQKIDVTKNGKESTIKIISKNSKGIPDGVTIFVDGKKTSKKELDKIDSNLIESVNVLKGKNALDKYAEDGANGVIDIITKKR